MKYRFYFFVRLLCLCLAAPAAFVSCSAEDEAYTLTQQPATHFEIHVNSGVRAMRTPTGPTGGDEGDGRHTAEERESKVKDATLLLYRSEQGINGADNVTIEHVLYAPDMTPKGDSEGGYTSGPLKADEVVERGEWHAIVVCNAGNLSKLRGETLGNVRNLLLDIPPYQWRDNDPQTAEYFVMSNAKDVKISVAGESSSENPLSISAEVQRMTGRVDFSPGNGTWTENMALGDNVTKTGYLYTEESNSGDGEAPAETNSFLLTEVRMINCYTQKPYLIKRVKSFGENGTITYLGSEGEGTGAKNYVMDPRTADKTDANINNLVSAYSFHLSDTEGKDINRLRQTTDSDWKETVDVNTNYYYYTLYYPYENTKYNTADSSPENFSTGIALGGYHIRRDQDNNIISYSYKEYPYFIRHADPDNSTDELPMKYGIVRNSLYRLFVGGVSSKGMLIIQVKDYHYIEVPPIYL